MDDKKYIKTFNYIKTIKTVEDYIIPDRYDSPW